MYYHCRELKYVEYGKVNPPPADKVDDWMISAYDWLGHHCGYNPQVWLARSHSAITGYRSSHSSPCVLFGFDVIKGFAVNYEPWCMLLNILVNQQTKTFDEKNKEIIKHLNEYIGEYEAGEEMDSELSGWLKCNRDLDRYLKEYLFKEMDQVVVPSLNLKAAKKIICSDDKIKKKLRKMGFIEDRIFVKNLKKWTW